MENKYIIFFKFEFFEGEEEQSCLVDNIKKTFEETNLKPVCFFGLKDVTIFNQETGEVISI
jgi:hypothetical protein